MKTLTFGMLAVAALLAASRSTGQVTIGSTTPMTGNFGYLSDSYWRGGNGWGMVTWAETIQTPGPIDVQLNEFRLYLQTDAIYGGDGTPVSFTAAVAEWDTAHTRLSGAPLWISDLQTTPATPGVFEPYTFNTGGLVLDPSKTYALLAVADFSADHALGGFGLTASQYSGGTYADVRGTVPSGSQYASLAGSSWSENDTANYDLAYAAAFAPEGVMSSLSPITAAPEPAVPGLALGLSGLAGYAAWRRKKAAKAASTAV